MWAVISYELKENISCVSFRRKDTAKKLEEEVLTYCFARAL